MTYHPILKAAEALRVPDVPSFREAMARMRATPRRSRPPGGRGDDRIVGASRPAVRGLAGGGPGHVGARLVAPGSVFEAAGALAHLRPASLEARRRDYGFWLGHLAGQGVDLRAEADPAARATPGRLQGFLEALAELSPRSCAGRLRSLRAVLSRAFPEADLEALRVGANRLDRIADAAGGVRSKAELPAAEVLLRLGRRIVDEAMAAGPSGAWDRVRLRDGAMIVLLIHHPLRRRTFAGLTIGGGYCVGPEGHMLHLRPEDLKRGWRQRIRVAPAAAEAMTLYMEHARPHLPGGEAPDGPLWRTMQGAAFTVAALGKRITEVCGRELARRVTPHLFRDAAVTAAVGDGLPTDEVGRRLTGHGASSTTRNHYDQTPAAKSFEAYAGLLEDLGRKVRRR